MNRPDDPHLRDILDRASEMAPQDRAAYLDSACANNPGLRAEIDLLLSYLDNAPDLLREPTFDYDPVPPSIEAPHLHLSESPGSRIGRYKLLQLIGEGGFGSVFMAEQETPVVRKVAIKIIKQGMDTKQVIARFEAERQALAMMDHPNIAKVFDAGSTESGSPYFVMELVKGTPITTFCDANKLTTRQRLELFVPVCSALQHAHQKGIIHRDLKPSNVLVTMHDDRPVPKVIDFGVAKALNQRLTAHTLFTEFRQLIGTPVYMSPEQAQLSGLDVDTRSDIYSLGVLIYELLTGTTPFDAQQLRTAAYDEMRRIIREVEPPKPSTRLSSLPDQTRSAVADQRRCDPRTLARTLQGELDWIVLQCLEKDRSRRYDTAGALSRDIQRYLDDELVEASPPSLSYRLRKLARRHRVVMGVALLLLAATAFSTWQAVRATHAARQALSQKLRADQQASVALTQTAEAQRQRKGAETQKAQAQRQTRIAESFNQFLMQTLGSDDPANLPLDKVTLAQAITNVVKQLDSQPSVDPIAEAGLRDTVGKIFYAMGQYDQAEVNLRKSLELFRKDPDTGVRDLANVTGDLATALAEQNKVSEAEQLDRHALDLYRKAVPPGDPAIANCLINLGQVLTREANWEAERYYREALAILRQAYPPGDPGLRPALGNLGMLLADLGKYHESERLLREALDNDRKALPPGHPQIATDLNDLGYLLARHGNPDETEKVYREALAIDRKCYPGGHPNLSRLLADLARLLAGKGQDQEAESMYREALAINRRLLPQNHPDIARILNCLATFLGDQHEKARDPEAESLYRQVIEMDRRTLPPTHPDVKIHLDNFTRFLLLRRRLADAEQLHRDTLELDRKALPAEHPRIAEDLGNVASLLQKQDTKLEEAESLYREAIRIERAAPPTVQTGLAVHVENLAFLLSHLNRNPESEKLFRETLDNDRKNNAPSLTYATHLGLLAMTLQRQDKFDEAKSLQREAVETDRRSHASPAALAKHLSELSWTLQRQEKLDEAESLLREVLTLRRAASPADNTATASAATDLGLLLLKMNRLSEAESLLREALKIYSSAPDDLAIANVSSGLGRTLLAESKYDEAEPLLRSALAIRVRKLGPTNFATVLTSSALADLLDRTSRPDLADELRKSHSIKSASTRPTTQAVSEGKS